MNPDRASRGREAGSESTFPRHWKLLGFLLATFLIFGRLGGLPLLDPDEGRNAEVAREMAVAGDWLVPTYNGLPYLDKPSFYFRLVALSFGVLGYSEFAARLPSALFGLALLVLVHRFCRREYGERTAVLAVAVVAAMPLFQALARIVIFDMPLAFFVCAAIVAGYRAEEHEGRARCRWYLVGAAATGCATLVKGPIGFILPPLVLLVFAAVERRKGVWRRMFRPLNLIVFSALVLPWFVGVSLHQPDFPYYGLIKESLERFTTPAFHRSGPVYYYIPVLFAVCFAWSCLFPESILLAWRNRSLWARADRLLLVWVVVVTVFFSISQSKLPGYVLTVVVALAILVARLFDRALESPEAPSARVVLRGAALLTVISVVGALWLSMEVYRPGALTSYFQIHGQDYERARTLFPTVLIVFLILVAASTLAWMTGRVRLVLSSLFIFPISLLTVSYESLAEYARGSSSVGLAEEIRTISPAATVVCVECYPTGLAFYLRRSLSLVTEDGSETTSNYIPFYLSRSEDWPSHVISPGQLQRWLEAQDGEVLLLARGERWPTLARLAAAKGGSIRDLPQGFKALLLPARSVS